MVFALDQYCNENNLDDLIEELDAEFESSDDGTHEGSHMVRKKRKSRSKYGAPKVWKDDIRWTYSKMLANVLNSMDPHLTYAMLKTFTSPDFRYASTMTKGGKPHYHFASTDIATYVKRWYVRSITSPDMSFHMEPPVVRNLPDGSSIIIAMMTTEITKMYKYPLFPEPEQAEMTGVTPALVLNPKELGVIITKSYDPKTHLMSVDGVRLNRRYASEKRIRVQGGSIDVDEDCSFLDELLALVPSEPIEPKKHKVRGSLVLRLDENKLIRSLEYVLKY